MFCGKCGTQNLDNAIFCKNCGLRLNGQEKVAEETTAKMPDKTQPQHKYHAPKYKHRQNKKIGIIVAAVAVLILAFVLLGQWRPEPIEIFLRIEFPDQVCGELKITVVNCGLTRLLVSLIQKAF